VFFNDRLYDFQGTGLPDPTMDVALLASLRKVCPPNLDSFGNAVPLDQGTDFVVDASYFTQIRMNHGILQIDQELTHDARTVKLIRNIARNFTPFGPSFARSMLKLGNVGVLTGKKGGEIRRICSKIN
jgi:peroxidase